MDPAALAQPETGFVAWIMANGQLIAFFAQIVYWLGMLVLIGYAVAQYKRWVNFQLGTGKSGQLRAAGHASAAEEKTAVSVEKFVE